MRTALQTKALAAGGRCFRVVVGFLAMEQRVEVARRSVVETEAFYDALNSLRFSSFSEWPLGSLRFASGGTGRYRLALRSRQWDQTFSDLEFQRLGVNMPAIFELLYKEFCRARLAEMRQQLLLTGKHPRIALPDNDRDDAEDTPRDADSKRTTE